MKIIDCDESKRNVIRFSLGEGKLKEWHGDDWNDIPYEHNAGEVYEEFVSGIMDVYVPWEYVVLFPADGEDNSPYSKDDMRNRKTPCVIIVPPEEFEYQWEAWRFHDYIGNERVIKIYMGDGVAETIEKIFGIGGFYRARKVEE